MSDPVLLCTKCKIEKPRDEFHRDRSRKNRGGRSNICRPCASAKSRKRTYNLSVDDIERMMQEQGSCCGVCGNELTPEKFVVDHCHDTDEIRGLLCSRCNTGLGLLGDNTEGLMKALKYLEKFNERLEAKQGAVQKVLREISQQ